MAAREDAASSHLPPGGGHAAWLGLLLLTPARLGSLLNAGFPCLAVAPPLRTGPPREVLCDGIPWPRASATNPGLVE